MWRLTAGAVVGILAAAAPAWAQDQGSFQPPIYSTDVDATTVAGTGVLALAGDITLGGVVGLLGLRLSDLFGLEVTVGGFFGKGTIDTMLQPALGGPSLSLSMVMFTLNPLLKLKPLDERANGWIGLTLYAGPSLASSTLTTTNELGSVSRGTFLLGVTGGGALTIRILGYVSLVGFGGARYLSFFGVEESKGLASPDYGGTIKVHLTPSWTIDIGSLLAQAKSREEAADHENVKIFMAGLSWSDRAPNADEGIFR